MALTDFWWLTSEQASMYVNVGLVHHQPLADKDSAPRQAFENPYIAEIQGILEWCNKYQNTNVYRSLKIWSDNSKREALSGPFIIDIDNARNLADTLIMTRKAVRLIFRSHELKESDIRLFFTGHKGFNIEVLPSVLGLVGTPTEQDNEADCIRKKIINELRRKAGLVSEQGQARNLVSKNCTIIDLIHDYIRLHDSINKWIECGVTIARKKIELPLSDFTNLRLDQILESSKIQF